MPSVHEQLTEQFRRWELRGRGWQVYREPVALEPPFRPFRGHYLPESSLGDDGVRPTVLSSFVHTLANKLSASRLTETTPVEEEDEPPPLEFVRGELVEFRSSLPAELDISSHAFEQFLIHAGSCEEPVGFELLGMPGQVSTQFVAGANDATRVRRHLQAHFPDVLFQPWEQGLLTCWEECGGQEVLIVEFGFAREFFFTLGQVKSDPFVGLIGALSELAANELGLFQVLFQAACHPWNESLIRSVTDPTGAPFFVNARELVTAATAKASAPLYAAVVRIAVKSDSFRRCLQIGCELAASLRVFSDPNGNHLIPLRNDAYPLDDHVEDVLQRQSRRSGMLLTGKEMVGFVHLPSMEVRSPALKRDTGKTKGAPGTVQNNNGVLIGLNVHNGGSVEVRLTPDQRVRHIHIIGASGTGKSTLLYNLIRQDIENGEGIALLDPHGDLVDRVLECIPSHRINDVVLVDPSDEEFSVGFNVLSAHSDIEKNLLASDLVSVFQRLSASWGDQMGSVLNNAILAALESSKRATLADLRRFLIEPAFRGEFLKFVQDPAILYYWQKAFPQLSGNKSIGPVLTRLETFLSPKPIRYMVSQPENNLDFGGIMDSGRIFLAKLSQGLLGNENSYLLGTLLVSKFQQLAMARQSRQAALRRNFWIYIDEFHNFITPTMAEILAGARKYRVGLTLAHQELRQLHRNAEVASAILSNPYTRICFRLGDDDARKLNEGFSRFEPRDLQNLGTGEALARVERSDFDFNLSVFAPSVPDDARGVSRRREVIEASRRSYAAPRAHIERILQEAWEAAEAEAKTASRRNGLRAPAAKATEPEKAPTSSSAPATPIPQPQPSLPAVGPATPASPPTVEDKAQATHPQIEPTLIPHVQKAEEPIVAKINREEVKELGRGGEQHKAIQLRIKEAAEKCGFRATIEKQVLDGAGSIDVLLERPDQTIACEITVSTPIDHEVGNMRKCLKTGFQKIAIVCISESRLNKLRAAVLGALGTEMAPRFLFLTPDTLIQHLSKTPPPEPLPAGPKKIRGYNVKRTYTKLSSEEQKAKDEEAHRVLSQTMLRKPE